MNWTEQDIQAIWQKAQTVDRTNPDKWRKDIWGAWISRQQFGNHDSKFGWEIDGQSANGGENGENGSTHSDLQPLQWKNAAALKNGARTGPITAYGGENIERP